MKKLTFILMCMLAVGATAQINLIDFEDGNLTNSKVSAITPPSGAYVRSSGVVDNPDATGVNKSAKVYNIIEGSTNTTVVANKVKHAENRVFVELKTPIVLDATSRYIHIMMRRNFVNNNCAVVMYLNMATQTDAPHGADLSRVTRYELMSSQANVWQDVVIDLQGFIDSEAAGELQTIALVPNINKYTPNQYMAYTNLYIDDIVFSADAAPRGAKAVKPSTGTIFDFEDKQVTMDNMMGTFSYILANLSTATTWVGVDGETTSIANDGEFALNVDFCAPNPDKTGINTSNSAIGTPGRGLQFYFNGANVPVNEDNRYLHIMVYSPEAESVITINPYNVNKPKTAVAASFAKFENVAVQNKWTDLVLDLSTITTGYLEPNVPITYLSGIGVSLANTPDANFYFDEIAVTNSPTPRTVPTPTSLAAISSDVAVISTAGRLVVRGADAAAQVSVFNIGGQEIVRTTVEHINSIPALSKGIYVVQIATKATKLIVE